MRVYHYEIIVHLSTLDFDEDTILRIFGALDTIRLQLDTNLRLSKDELLTITTDNQAMINLEVTRIVRYGFQVNDEDKLIEKDMSNPWYQENRPDATSDEAWFSCSANALTLVSNYE